MRISAMKVNSGGVFYYRAWQPLQELAKLGHQIIWIDPMSSVEEVVSLAANSDIFYIASPLGDTWTTLMTLVNGYSQKVHKHMGEPVKIVCDFDDCMLSPSPYNSIYALVGRRDAIMPTVDGTYDYLWKSKEGGEFDIAANKKRLLDTNRAIVKYASAITSPSQKIVRKVKQFWDKPSLYLPNGINMDKFNPLFRQNSVDGIIRIGYTCSDSHYRDYMEMMPTIAKVIMSYPNVRFVQIGAKFKYDKFLPIDRVEYYEWTPTVSGYADLMSSLPIDIGVCHVNKDLFNSYKSILKWEEFSALKIPCVVSQKLYGENANINDTNAATYSNLNELDRKLRNLIDSKEYRNNLTNNAYKVVKENFEVGVVGKIYEQEFLKLTSKIWRQ